MMVVKANQRHMRKQRMDGMAIKWKPIETAPKDGMEILVCANVAWYGLRVDSAEWDHAKNRWTNGGALNYDPTHWAKINGPKSE